PPCDDHDSSRRHSLSFCSSYPDLRDLHSFPTRRSSDLGGALGYWALPVSALPQVDFPTVQVTTQLPGASPDVVASLITAPLERQLGQMPALAAMMSTSSFGISQISLQFDLGRDIDGATQDVQAAINGAAGVLPRNLPYPPTYAKVNPADAAVMTLALT